MSFRPFSLLSAGLRRLSGSVLTGSALGLTAGGSTAGGALGGSTAGEELGGVFGGSMTGGAAGGGSGVGTTTAAGGALGAAGGGKPQRGIQSLDNTGELLAALTRHLLAKAPGLMVPISRE